MTRICTAVLAVVAGLGAYCLPGASLAGNIGYYGTCSTGSTPVAQITAAGHTPVAVALLDANSLAGLDALLLLGCSFSANAAVDTAVANGMNLIVHDWDPDVGTAAKLPGAPAINIVSAGGSDIDLPTGSPIATGPGGVLTNASMDQGTSSNHGYATIASFPAGVSALTTTANHGNAVTFTYRYGAGRVVYGAIPLDHYLPGGTYSRLGLCDTNPVCTGMSTYLTNVIAWAVPSFTSCAAEGFSGTKLTLCRQVCEMHYTGTKLNALIRTWTSLYHQDPPCAN